MYFQHQMPHPVFRMKYFTPDSPKPKDAMTNHDDDVLNAREKTQNQDAKGKTKPFLEPHDSNFAQIRQRLSTLTLNTEYKGAEKPSIPLSFHRDRARFPPKRISSINSHDTAERYHNHAGGGARLQSRASFQSDDREYRYSKRNSHFTRHRNSEAVALNKLNENILTPGQNPELFSRQIKLSGERPERFPSKTVHSRSSSPKSVRSVDSSGKVHLGLIDSLDLNERLNDVEKIKERYSNDTFIHSLAMYKMRGHDRCLKQSGMSEHIPRGTKLPTPEDHRSGSKMSDDNMYYIPAAVSPRLGDKTRPFFVNSTKWEHDRSYFQNQIEALSRGGTTGSKQTMKNKKSVGFAKEPQELTEGELQDRAQPPVLDSPKEPKSILKRTGSRSTNRDTINMDNNDDDEFLVDEKYHWKFQLPKIHSPSQSFRARPPLSFRKKMYHFGDGVSEEFDQVVSKYGNCRQSSWVREHSYARDQSMTKE